MPPCAFCALIAEAGTTASCAGTPPRVKLTALVADGATENATAALPTVPLYVPAGSVSASWHVVPPPEAGEQPLEVGPTRPFG